MAFRSYLIAISLGPLFGISLGFFDCKFNAWAFFVKKLVGYDLYALVIVSYGFDMLQAI